MDDPFAALVEELNLQNDNEQNQGSINDATNLNHITDKGTNKELNKQTDEEIIGKTAIEANEEQPETEKPKEQQQENEVKYEEAQQSNGNAEEEQEEQEEQEEAEEDEVEEEDDNDEGEAAFMASIHEITVISELRDKFISFYKDKETEIYELKNKFTEISGRQKEVFIEVENRRKTAIAKGKKYKQTAQKLHYQINKLNNDLKFERKKIDELNDEISIIRDQKKQREEAIEALTNNIHLLKSNLTETQQNRTEILDEYQQTHSVIDKLIQNEKIQEKLKCFIAIELDDEKKNNNTNNNTNLSILKLQFLDETIDHNSISIQWNRSYFTQFIAIKNANKLRYKSSADDIGSIIKVEVRSKDNPDCYQSAVLKNGSIKMHKVCAKIVEENLLKIHKQQIEFAVEPDITEANTASLLSSQKKKHKHLILLFNKDKIKLRTTKNVTIDKEQYNDSMKMNLSSINPNRFSFKFSANKKYVFNSKSSLERDNIAILLRSYIERLKRNTNPILCDFYLRISNERRNYEILNKYSGENTLTRDELVSKILAPISSNPRISPQSFTTGTTNSNSINMVSLLTAPATNPVINNEPSLTNEEVVFDVDEIFPDFTDKKEKEKEKEKDEIQFDEDEVDLETQNQHKKAWKKLQFAENATIASAEELAKNAIVPAPSSRSTKTKTKTKTKGKKKAKTKKKKKNSKNNNIIRVIAEITDRLDCLLSVDGVILKHQIVGNLIFKCDSPMDSDNYFIAKISNLENTKTKIFNPLNTEEIDKNGKIKVKLLKDDNEKSIGVLKYVWNTKEMEKYLPFLILLNTENTDDIYNVSCIIKPNGDWNGLIKEFCITGVLKDDVKECIQYTEENDIQFVWSQSLSKKFMWSLKTDKINKEYVLNSKFKGSSNNNKVQLKIQFEIENIGISNIQIDTDDKNQNNNVEIIKIIKNIRSGEFHVR